MSPFRTICHRIAFFVSLTHLAGFVPSLRAGAADEVNTTRTHATELEFPSDQTPPQVVSIVRESPAEQLTSSTELAFRVTFSEPVTGVDVSDFLFSDGNTSGWMAGIAASSDTTYIVSTYFWARGEIGLDLRATGTGIVDAAGNAIASGFDQSERFVRMEEPGLYADNTWGKTLIVGTAFEFTFEVEGAESVAVDDLPAWATLEWSPVDANESSIAVIRGVPTQTGTWQLNIRASNALAEVTREITLDVQTPPSALGIHGVHGFIRDFESETPDGYRPRSGLIEHEGWLYGTTSQGGSHGVGTVFRLQVDADGREIAYENVHHFDSTQGETPLGTLLVIEGWLYGTTTYGGEASSGVAYRIHLEGDFAFEILHAFQSGIEARPIDGLTLCQGWLYGTTEGGWENDSPTLGCIFRLRPDGSDFSIVHAFDAAEAEADKSRLVALENGRLYGTSQAGGASQEGTIFGFDPATSTLEILHTFSSETEHGIYPAAPLTDGRDGWLYGSTSGYEAAPVLFRIAPDGSGFTILKRFLAGAAYPKSAPGGIHPQTRDGGAYGGVGASVLTGLTAGSDGLLYGVSSSGGTAGAGFAFAVRPDGSGYEVLAHLDGESTGAVPAGPLCEASDGRLYGTTEAGISLRAKASVGAGGASLLATATPAGTSSGLRGAVFAIELPHPAISAVARLEATEDQPFTYTIIASDAPTRFGAVGLPEGLTIDSATGVITGTPTRWGIAHVVLSASRGLHVGTHALTLDVKPAQPQAYFGTIADDGGEIAAYLDPARGSGTLIGFVPDRGLGFMFNFTLGNDGAFSGPAAVVFGDRAAAPRGLAAMRLQSSSGYTISGIIAGGVLTGRIEGLGLDFSAAVDSSPGEAHATYYTATAVDTVGGTLHGIVGPSGHIFVLASLAGRSQSGSGSVASDGTAEIDLDDGSSLAIALHSGRIEGTLITDGGVSRGFSGTESATDRDYTVVNLSSRGNTGRGEDTTIAGFVLSGTGTKQVLLRVVGPGLSGLGVENPADDPALHLFDPQGRLLATCDDWSGDEIATAAALTGAFPLSAGSRDAALLIALPAGPYTILASNRTGSGVVLAEVYDADTEPGTCRVSNISVRGRVQSGENVLIEGFVVTGNSPKRMLVRAVGPTLATLGVEDPLADPQLALFNGDNAIIAFNDDWEAPTPARPGQIAATAAEIIAAAEQASAFPLPEGGTDAAIVINLVPGAYTVHAGSKGDATGVALIEVYELAD